MTVETWLYIDTGKQRPGFNMALDEKLMDWHRKGLIEPVVRFYEWEPATLSLGYFQRIDKDIDLSGVERHGAGLVRRPTGGRAVLHDDELTYSVIVKESHEQMPATVTEAYRVISQGLLEGFRSLELNADFSIPRTDLEKAELRNPRSAVCFDAPSWYEMVVNGKKIAGSAQTRQKGIILQHGSLIRTIDENKLFDMFKFPNERLRNRMQKGFKEKAVPLADLMEELVTVETMKNHFKAGFEKALQIYLQPYQLSSIQLKEVEELAASKYDTKEWTYKY
ncbi:biotin/lipoate A/B protein ligase family protein [Alkalicoccus halolimnae]|uniref:Biotin/lipoate A/B protein ligase family protein n=2 Tax=Alkalicoccus halolimnae TaxID=1667239 RepID=A0A5C7FGF2_9BACI|nr:biotin/lipoate A/B protein ligase family protein [Alkalicoccus halolimnae]TXF86377.1 lipoate--protein ligase family protein [Alkalicoccus halolimnae]